MKKPTISIIAALSENRVIGNKGRIPWHIPQDLQRFWQKTKNQVIIMGRKTFESILGYYQKSKKPFPKRTFIIITRNKDYQVNRPNCYPVHSVKQGLDLTSKFKKDEVFISGGAQIYQQTINLADKLYLTVVKGNFKGDAYFPKHDGFQGATDSGWKKEGKYQFKFMDLVRK